MVTAYEAGKPSGSEEPGIPAALIKTNSAGFHCAALAHQKMGTDRYGTIRVSLGAFNHKNEADAFCMAVKHILAGR